MPVAPAVSYPGVYIQEVPSDVRTITPVETATTAFIGRALCGPVNKPVICNSYADFQRIFGGRWLESTLGYAVSDFFQNGGSKAVVVRLYPVAVQAAEAVRKAVEAKAKGGATPDKLKEAAKTAAAAFTDGPAKDAAAAVVKAVENAAAQPKATVDSVVQAAQTAAPRSKASLTVKGRVPASAKAAADAVLAAAKKAAEPGDAKSEAVKKAANDEADKYKEKGPARDAAQQVLEAVGNIGDDAGKEGIAAALNNIKPSDITQAAGQAYLQPLILEAKHPGAWGNNLCARITDVDKKVRTQLAERYGVGEPDLFNVTVHDKATGATETFPNVTVVVGPRRLDKVLDNESELIAVAGVLPAQWPFAHLDPAQGTTFWNDADAHDAVDQAGQAIDGPALEAGDFTGSEADKTGIYALEHADIFNLLCIPPYNLNDDVDKPVLDAAATYCEERRAMLLLDPPATWVGKDKAKQDFPTIPGVSSPNAAIFFPRIQAPNPLRDNQVEVFAPCGTVAGVFARTDATRGVWKAPAGLEATLRGVAGLTVPLTDAENGELNPLGINCLRQVPAAGYVVWGARTIVGDDRLASQWKYIPVRRTALYIEESLYRGTQWAVFEPNDEPLWSQLRLNIGVFMHGLFRQGAFQGQSPKEAYFVKCDKTTTTQADIGCGIVNVIVGFAPLKPAEFVVLYIQQMAGQLAV
jgi:phage tail sheath protein FI